MDLSKVNVNEIQKKGIKALIIIGIVFVVLIAFISLSQLIFGTVLPYDRVEEVLVESAEKYYNANKNKLPKQDGDSVTIDDTALSTGKFMKPIVKYTKEEEACTGEVKVTKNGKNYIYTPKLKCSDKYETTLAVDVIKEEVVTEGSGIYHDEKTNAYVYRGEFVNNYFEYGGQTWRILQITPDNKIRLIQEEITQQVVWDNRYNKDRRSNVGINNFSLSRLRETLNKFYQDGEIIKKSYADLIIPQSKCAKYQETVDKDGNTQNECVSYDYKNQIFTTLYAEEYNAASLDNDCHNVGDETCANYNYLGGYSKSYWTISTDPDTTHKVYKINGSPMITNAAGSAGVKVVIELSGDVLLESGKGTENKPYKIRRFGN